MQHSAFRLLYNVLEHNSPVRTLRLLLSMANCICCARVFAALRALAGSKFEWDIQVLPRELKTSIIEKRVQLSG